MLKHMNPVKSENESFHVLRTKCVLHVRDTLHKLHPTP